MKDYHEYEMQYIGESDMASLLFVGCSPRKNGITVQRINFGEDNKYMAYIVDENAEIGAHYKKVATFRHWIKIYDDDSRAFRCKSDTINVYRAGEMGCIIQLLNKKGEN